MCAKENSLQPTAFYRWQKQVFESLPPLFERKSVSELRRGEEEIRRLRQITACKDEVVAEVTGELMAAKKDWGPLTAGWSPESATIWLPRWRDRPCGRTGP